MMHFDFILFYLLSSLLSVSFVEAKGASRSAMFLSCSFLCFLLSLRGTWTVHRKLSRCPGRCYSVFRLFRFVFLCYLKF